ncbi:STAS domain-containing protein [Streptomyces lavendulocolor]|uniref:STAS domain-containing protein n=1 Tax=Streptomyces lavendulocolor TaxID=67316 RepID=UPI0031D70D91
MPHLTTSTGTTPTGPVVTVAGDLDHQSAARLRDALRDVPLRPGETLLLDLHGLTFCDSSGISVFIAAHRQAETAQARMALQQVPDTVARVLTVVGLDQVFEIRPGTGTGTGNTGTRASA